MARTPACSPRLSIVEHYREMEALDRVMPNRYCYLRSALTAAQVLASGNAMYLDQPGNRAYQQRILDLNRELFVQARREEAIRMARREAGRK